MISWIHDRRTADWIDNKEDLCSPAPLNSLPFVNNVNALHSVTGTYVVYNILEPGKM